MKRYVVTFSRKSLRDLHKLQDYFERRFDPASVEKFAESVISDCESLAVAPHRGTPISGKAKQYRLTGFAKGRVSVLFEIPEEAVKILALRYGGYR